MATKEYQVLDYRVFQVTEWNEDGSPKDAEYLGSFPLDMKRKGDGVDPERVADILNEYGPFNEEINFELLKIEEVKGWGFKVKSDPDPDLDEEMRGEMDVALFICDLPSMGSEE